jgi:hypothetical protein
LADSNKEERLSWNNDMAEEHRKLATKRAKGSEEKDRKSARAWVVTISDRSVKGKQSA